MAGIFRYGTLALGEKHGLAKLNTEKVKLIRASTESPTQLSRKLNVHRTTINDVLSFRTWRHVR